MPRESSRKAGKPGQMPQGQRAGVSPVGFTMQRNNVAEILGLLNQAGGVAAGAINANTQNIKNQTSLASARQGVVDNAIRTVKSQEREAYFKEQDERRKEDDERRKYSISVAAEVARLTNLRDSAPDETTAMKHENARAEFLKGVDKSKITSPTLLGEILGGEDQQAQNLINFEKRRANRLEDEAKDTEKERLELWVKENATTEALLDTAIQQRDIETAERLANTLSLNTPEGHPASPKVEAKKAQIDYLGSLLSEATAVATQQIDVLSTVSDAAEQVTPIITALNNYEAGLEEGEVGSDSKFLDLYVDKVISLGGIDLESMPSDSAEQFKENIRKKVRPVISSYRDEISKRNSKTLENRVFTTIRQTRGPLSEPELDLVLSYTTLNVKENGARVSNELTSSIKSRFFSNPTEVQQEFIGYVEKGLIDPDGIIAVDKLIEDYNKEIVKQQEQIDLIKSLSRPSYSAAFVDGSSPAVHENIRSALYTLSNPFEDMPKLLQAQTDIKYNMYSLGKEISSLNLPGTILQFADANEDFQVIFGRSAEEVYSDMEAIYGTEAVEFAMASRALMESVDSEGIDTTAYDTILALAGGEDNLNYLFKLRESPNDGIDEFSRTLESGSVEAVNDSIQSVLRFDRLGLLSVNNFINYASAHGTPKTNYIVRGLFTDNPVEINSSATLQEELKDLNRIWDLSQSFMENLVSSDKRSLKETLEFSSDAILPPDVINMVQATADRMGVLPSDILRMGDKETARSMLAIQGVTNTVLVPDGNGKLAIFDNSAGVLIPYQGNGTKTKGDTARNVIPEHQKKTFQQRALPFDLAVEILGDESRDMLFNYYRVNTDTLVSPRLTEPKYEEERQRAMSEFNFVYAEGLRGGEEDPEYIQRKEDIAVHSGYLQHGGLTVDDMVILKAAKSFGFDLPIDTLREQATVIPDYSTISDEQVAFTIVFGGDGRTGVPGNTDTIYIPSALLRPGTGRRNVNWKYFPDSLYNK